LRNAEATISCTLNAWICAVSNKYLPPVQQDMNKIKEIV